jgi:hypothetical protein
MYDESIYKFKCEKCNFFTNYNSALLKHIETEFHKTGKRKVGIFSIDLFNKHIDSEKHKNNLI